eukprot:CAMPEP_0202088568 /NCGR_PEP_ID=MMETSP0964-20121228/38899_1 /ASSEMBLY_ACC=CAM_ASM_000500 /TAXON_ID=4773 /ORGANISM="Schizochytrium aggregatum, Strain ATCC28209" /LENGTH=259 /DNA_ID=CAMNT_0048656595 /DNA_START=93 /DNA_END=869 /DNA_ORIENTATION=-
MRGLNAGEIACNGGRNESFMFFSTSRPAQIALETQQRTSALGACVSSGLEGRIARGKLTMGQLELSTRNLKPAPRPIFHAWASHTAVRRQSGGGNTIAHLQTASSQSQKLVGIAVKPTDGVPNAVASPAAREERTLDQALGGQAPSARSPCDFTFKSAWRAGEGFRPHVCVRTYACVRTSERTNATRTRTSNSDSESTDHRASGRQRSRLLAAPAPKIPRRSVWRRPVQTLACQQQHAGASPTAVTCRGPSRKSNETPL